MGGGWVGYIYVFGGCTAAVLLLVCSTLFLYGVARLKRGDRRAKVTSVGGSPEA